MQIETTILTNVIIALCSLATVVVNIWLLRSDRKNRAEESWHRARSARKRFWETSRKAYAEYQVHHKELTEDLQNLIHQAGMPPDAPGNEHTGKIAWEATNLKKLSAEQKHLYQFAKWVYPERTSGSYSHAEHSKLAVDDFDILDTARREVDNVFMIWGKRLSLKKFTTIYKHGKDDCILLCWYDLALIQWTHDEGLGDPTIYRLGYHYMKTK